MDHPPLLRHEVLSETVLREAVREQVMFRRHIYGKDRPLLVALYAGTEEDVALQVQNATQWASTERMKAERLFALIGPGAPNVVLERLGAERMKGVLEVEAQTASVELIESRLETLVDLGCSPLSLCGALQQLLLGERAVEASVLDEHPGLRTEVEALALLVAGSWDQARAKVLEALAPPSGRSKSKKKPSLKSPQAPLLVLALATGTDEQRQTARALLGRSASKTSPLGVLRAWLEGQPVASWVHFEDWRSELIARLCRIWSQTPKDVLGDVVPAPMVGALEHRGMRWPARQLLNASGDASGSADGPSLVDLMVSVAPWEFALRRLEDRYQESEAEPVQSAERLVWLVRVYSGSMHIAPLLQKRKRGGWSKGRPVALHRLASPDELPVGPSDEDRAVAATLVVESDSYGQRTYRFGSAAALALVGHPRVLRSDDRRPVEIVEEPAFARIERTTAGCRVSISPPGLTQPRSEDLGDRIRVYRPDSSLQELESLLGGPTLEVPSSGEARLQSLLGKMASTVPLRSELDIQSQGDSVPTDAEPSIEIRRRDDGLELRPRVYPLGDDGPSFAPGSGSATVAGRVQGTLRYGTRDLEAERSAFERLLDACPSLQGTPIAENTPAVLEFELGASCLLELGAAEARLGWPEGQPLSVHRASSASLRVRLAALQSSWFEVGGELKVDEARVHDLKAVLDALGERRGRFVPIGDDQLLALSEDLLGRLHLLAAASDPDQPQLDPVAAGVVASWDDLESLELDAEAERRLQRCRDAAQRNPRIPRALEAELRPYQKEGFQWMSRLAHWGAGACLADDMGLGKTLQALTLLLARARSGPQLVVAPTSVCANWVAEATRFTPTLTFKILSDIAPKELGSFDVLVISHTSLALRQDAVAEIEWATVVYDEAQAIKNPDTHRARAAHALKAEFRLALSGTPIENNLFELWSLMRFLNPSLLGSKKRFETRFLRPIQAAPSDATPEALEQLRRLISPFLLRRTKRAVLKDLPPRTNIVLEVEPSEDEEALAEAMRQKALARFAESGGSVQDNAMHFLAELTKLRQVACHPSLVAPDLDLPSSKLERLVELLAELKTGGHRALVFSQFVRFLEMVRERLEAEGLQIAWLDGKTPPKQRADAVAEFQAGDADAFLISLKAGGTGLNLTGADYVIHLDPWWNPAAMDQASDRAHRIGQTRPVTVIELVTSRSIEARVLELHADKRDLAERLLDGQHTATRPDAEALYALLSAGPAQAST